MEEQGVCLLVPNDTVGRRDLNCQGVKQQVPCVSGGLPKPANITFLSINMKNVLQWNRPEDLQGVKVTYTVEYFILQTQDSDSCELRKDKLSVVLNFKSRTQVGRKGKFQSDNTQQNTSSEEKTAVLPLARYGQKKWLNKSECRNISRTYCDLSAETSDYEHQYYAKVKAIWGTECSKWAESGRFYPFLETQIGPPEVALTMGDKSISVVLTAPEKWKRNPEDIPISMQQIYSNLKYNVSVSNTKSNRTWSQCVTNHTLVLTWLEPNTLYCVHVESFVPGPPRRAQPSEKQCARTLKAPAGGNEFPVEIINTTGAKATKCRLNSKLLTSALQHWHISVQNLAMNVLLGNCAGQQACMLDFSHWLLLTTLISHDTSPYPESPDKQCKNGSATHIKGGTMHSCPPVNMQKD
ncbi:Interleukin-20 receptor subunit alpha [Saguinus oedipus]|uniref:Interleukin-20 receptor subunit alpha n=1 Tax=Saguinus oedipus TaxID=9490 RepID=A0ABQ9W0Q5_SAGOE|nr:Interleukin-20 receptor subunit alpha [Saguinus oedipus]